MRNRKKVVNESKEMPMATMIDVVFLLLIYFIVTQKPILEETLITSNLPSGISSEITGFPLTIDVLEEDGDAYRVMNRKWKPQSLFKYLQTISENDPDQAIIINCGAKSRHSKLIKLLDACSEAELSNLNIVDAPGDAL